MANNRFNKQVSPKGYVKGGKVRKISKGVRDRNVTSAETIRLLKLANKKKK